jgi:hypothetical protein
LLVGHLSGTSPLARVSRREWALLGAKEVAGARQFETRGCRGGWQCRIGLQQGQGGQMRLPGFGKLSL